MISPKAEKNWPEKAAAVVADGPDSPGHRLHPGEPFSEALLCVDAAAEGGGGNAAHHSAHKFVLAPGRGLRGREEQTLMKRDSFTRFFGRV
jgi:hypothetical protein